MNEKVLATPAVRRIARENNVNLWDIKPSHKSGRISKEDVMRHLSATGNQSSAPFIESLNSVPTPTTEKPTMTSSTPAPSTPISDLAISVPRSVVEDRDMPIRGIQKQMVKTMTAAASVPHFGFCEEFVVDEVIAMRNSLKPIAAAKNIKLTYLPFFIKSCSVALSHYPILNAHLYPYVVFIYYFILLLLIYYYSLFNLLYSLIYLFILCFI
jgi:2-oxoisovalerate dehydrogenase E2 component (dihydrolipoyl transacylase)